MTSSGKNKTVVIAGGGTGGHVYPGVAIARAIQKKNPDIQVHFVGTSRGIEDHVVPREGFPLHRISVGQFHKSIGWVKRLKTLVRLPMSFWQCLSLCLQLKPRAVLGVGGYASGPFVLVASLLGYRTFIWEPNAYPGLANRILSRFVKKCFVVFSSSRKFLKTKNVEECGIPVRFSLEIKPFESSSEFKVLVFGGSQGARAINEVIQKSVLEKKGDWLKGLRIVHQTGKTDFETIKKRYSSHECPEVEVHEFLYDMKEQLEKADLVICRGGASTIAELMACGKASIIIPFPSAADNHQQKNAEEMVKIGAAKMVLQSELSEEVLIQTISSLREEPNTISKMSVCAREAFRPGAAEDLASRLL